VTPRRGALAAVACAGLLLAACSGHTASTTKPTVPTTVHHGASSTTSTGVTTSTAASTSTTSATATATACNTVTASVGQQQGAAGTATGLITVTNVGRSACTVDGYPQLALYAGNGTPLVVTVVEGLTVQLSAPASAPPSTLTLMPSQQAQFAYQYSDVPVGSETSCPVSETGAVTMPGAVTSSSRFALHIGPCNNGTVHVSPVYAGP